MPENSRLLVEQQQPSSFYSFVNNLHFMRGYPQPYFATRAWGMIVSRHNLHRSVGRYRHLVGTQPRERRLGGICLSAGCLLFLLLAILLCR